MSTLETSPTDVEDLTAGLWKEWKLSRRNTQMIGYKELTAVRGLLLDEPRLAAEAREALSKRIPPPKVAETSFEDGEFDAITSAARRMFRTAHLRITENARHLADWRAGAFARDCDEWLLGEALDHLARTGTVPCYRTNTYTRIIYRYIRVLGGERSEDTWQRLFLTRMEAVALGVLLLAEHGWNLSVINRLAVPRATPDAGPDGKRIYRVELEKHKRGAGRYFETRNLTDDGADTPGRLITQALEATVFARAAVHDLSPGTDRLMIWRTGKTLRADAPGDQTKGVGVGPFRFGIAGYAAKRWAMDAEFASSPFRRGRRTVNVVHRREPGQNSQDTHDSTYVLADPRAQAAAIPVIAAAAEAVVAKAHEVVFGAELRETADPADQPTATVDCHDYENSPFPSPDGGCGASFLLCLACPNARVHDAHHSRLAHLHQALDNLRSVMDPGQWQSDWGDAYARLEHLKSERLLGAAIWSQALDRVTDADRALINYLLNGDFDQ
ncbi:hypothetical protein [Streptomyces tauricus]|uniref:hypothetical protein n=1 Tax=Streptomyces tauricus TaxID=68274 RepID=UPI0033AF3C3E